jgi:hypothetical protein
LIDGLRGHRKLKNLQLEVKLRNMISHKMCTRMKAT